MTGSKLSSLYGPAVVRTRLPTKGMVGKALATQFDNPFYLRHFNLVSGCLSIEDIREVSLRDP